MYKSIYRIFLIVLFVGFVGSVTAQLKIGVLGGLNNNKLFGDAPESASYKSKTGLLTGLQIDYYVHPTVAISLQPSFSSEGAKLFYSVAGVQELVDSGKVSLNYLRIPLLAKINFNNDRLYALAGFDIGLLQNATIELNEQEEEKLNKKLFETDFSFQTGVGYRWHINSITLFLEGRYVVGLQNLSNEFGASSSLSPRIKNGGFKILFGVEVPLWTPKG